MGRIRDLKQNRGKGRRDRSGTGCLGCFGGIWLLFVLVFDGFIGYGFYRTYDARAHYRATTGTVTSAGVESHSDSDGGTNYSAAVEFAYSVDGAAYTGDRHSFFRFSTSSHNHAQGIVDRYPVGREVTVHYDPDDPGESVLEVDASSFAPIILLFMTPFHCIGIGLVGGGVVQTLRKRRGDDAVIAPYVVRNEDQKLVLHDARWPGWMVFLFVLGGTSFVMVFVVAFVMGIDTPLATTLWVWSGCVGAAMLAPTLLRLRRAGRADRAGRLTIDWYAGRFSRVPGSADVAIADIRTIRLVASGTNTRVNGQAWYKLTISGLDGAGAQHTLLVAKGYAAQGEALRDWFAQRFEAASEESDLPEEEEEASTPIVSEVEINRTKT